MAADEKKAKAKEKAAPKEKPVVEAPAKDKTAADAATVADVKTEAKAETPKDYSRGEGQKPVSQAYKDNWDAIFGKKKKKRPAGRGAR
jgi:hypothetical protein